MHKPPKLPYYHLASKYKLGYSRLSAYAILRVRLSFAVKKPNRKAPKEIPRKERNAFSLMPPAFLLSVRRAFAGNLLLSARKTNRKYRTEMPCKERNAFSLNDSMFHEGATNAKENANSF